MGYQFLGEGFLGSEKECHVCVCIFPCGGSELGSPVVAPAVKAKGKEHSCSPCWLICSVHLSQLPTGRHMWHVDGSLWSSFGSAGHSWTKDPAFCLSGHPDGCLPAEVLSGGAPVGHSPQVHLRTLSDWYVTKTLGDKPFPVKILGSRREKGAWLGCSSSCKG